MSSVLVIHEISGEREEIVQALEGEGFQVVQAGSAADGVREVWAGSFIVAVVGTPLTGTTNGALKKQLEQMAPEIETVLYNKNEPVAHLVRKVCNIRDGVAAA